MKVAACTEITPGEKRVALIPETCKRYVKQGLEVVIQRGAGLVSGFRDQEYADAGATLEPDPRAVLGAADIVLKVRKPAACNDVHEADLMREGAVLIGFLDPLTDAGLARKMAERRLTAFAVELVPRITRAQNLDALSSMATVAGYKAVLLAAEALPRMFPMLMTAAGTVTPARVLVIGAGVAGLQAIATARRLGAVVSGYDVRPAVKEQVQSLGAKFVELNVKAEEAETKGGYAKEMGEEFYRRQREAMTKVVSEHDVVITTAAVPGKKAPVLITAEMVRAMPAGSVIVDLAAEMGGNCELTRPGETVVEQEVRVLGPVNLAASAPYHASQMYARNLANFVKLLAAKGELVINMEDEVVRESMVTHQGDVVHPRVKELLGVPHTSGVGGLSAR